MSISVIGAGAFGTGLAIALAQDGRDVTLVARDAEQAQRLASDRENQRRLPGHPFPDGLKISADVTSGGNAIALLAVPTQSLPDFLKATPAIQGFSALVACCKGIDLTSLTGPSQTIAALVPGITAAVLTGPSFATDIASGLPTALTLACEDPTEAARLQAAVGCETLRIYRTDDTIGAELGGALKNVIAIACGAAIGAGLGESARAALVTRGFAEMRRLALHLGARTETLSGLSGFGDLVLTCTSPTSRNYRFGAALAAGTGIEEGTTVEGASTARAALDLGMRHGIDMPITAMVVQLIDGDLTVAQAMAALLARPQTKE